LRASPGSRDASSIVRQVSGAVTPARASDGCGARLPAWSASAVVLCLNRSMPEGAQIQVKVSHHDSYYQVASQSRHGSQCCWLRAVVPRGALRPFGQSHSTAAVGIARGSHVPAKHDPCFQVPAEWARAGATGTAGRRRRRIAAAYTVTPGPRLGTLFDARRLRGAHAASKFRAPRGRQRRLAALLVRPASFLADPEPRGHYYGTRGWALQCAAGSRIQARCGAVRALRANRAAATHKPSVQCRHWGECPWPLR
jgi:hypothetical protein